MGNKKNKLGLKIAVFLVITAVFLWLLPGNLIFGDAEQEQSQEQTITQETIQETTEDTIAENTEETTPETTQETSEVITEETNTEVTGDTTQETVPETTETTITEITDTIVTETPTSETTDTTITDTTQEQPVENNVLSDGIILDPELSTDKEDYHPEETVIISGRGFAPNIVYTIVVIRPDGSIVVGDGSFTPGSDDILTDAHGKFTYNYILDGIMGIYRVKAVDENGETVASMTFTDCDAYIQLHKYFDKDGNNNMDGSDTYLEGAVFKLYKESGGGWGSAIDTQSSDANGLVKFHITSEGTYKVVEYSTLPGFSSSFDSGPIIIDASNEYSTIDLGNVANTLIDGDIELCKSGLEGIMAADYAGFTLFDSANNPVGIEKTLAGNGTITWNDIVFGTYTIKETHVPMGYNAIADIAVNINLEDDHLYHFEAVNVQDPGLINLLKKDAVNGDPLEGSVFRLFIAGTDNQALDFEGDHLVPDAVTDANGQASFENLAWGTYLVKEIDPPEGYLPMEVEVTIDGEHLVINLESEIADPRISGKINISKEDSDGNGLTGAGFTLFKSDGSTVAVPEKMVDAAGKVTFDHLKWGIYIVRETTVPDGFSGADDKSVTINAGNTETTIKLTFENTPTTTTTVTTEGIIQVAGLAATGVTPIIPIAGIGTIVGGMGLLMMSLLRKKKK